MNVQRLPALGPYRKPLQIISHPHTIFFFYRNSVLQRDIEALSCNHCCSGKAISIIYCECVFVALGFQHAKCMSYIVICGLSSCTIWFVWNISQSKKNPVRYYYKDTATTLFLSYSNQTWNFWSEFRKISKYQFLWKSVQWEPICCMRSDRQKWRSE